LHTLRCSLQLTRYDPVPGNNVLQKDVMVAELDAACRLLVAPSGAYDSGTSVTPEAWIRNFGNLTQNFPVRLAVGSFYADTQTVTLAPAGSPGDSLLVGFDPVTLVQRGPWAVTCSTMLSGDRTDSNDVRYGSMRVRVTDMLVADVPEPPDTVIVGGDAPLHARFYNSGTDSVTVWTYYRVEQGTDGAKSSCKVQDAKGKMAGSAPRSGFADGGVDSVVYYDSAEVVLGPLAESLVVFDTLRNLTELAVWNITASCPLTGDQIPTNNTLSRTLFVYEHDVACSLLVAPGGTYDSGTLVTPQAWLRNLGSQAETFNCSLSIGGYYRVAKSVSLAAAGSAGASQLVSFDTVRLRVRGAADVRCRTLLTGDRNSGNDLGTGSVYVRVTDAAVTAIPMPPETVFAGDDVEFWARVENRSTDAGAMRAYFMAMYGGDTVALFDSADVTIAALDDSVIVFDTILAISRMGDWQLSAWCVLAADQHPENDTFTASLYVGPPGGIAWPPGWWEAESLPRGLSGKPIKAGGALAVMQNGNAPFIYALKGNKTNEFYRFEVLENTWTALTPVDPGPDGRLPYSGSSLCTDNDGHVYMVKGNNTCEFWRYNTVDSSWLSKDDVLPGPNRSKVKGGDDLAYVERNDSGYVYLLKGLRKEFYRFNVRRDTWETLDSAPTGSYGKWNKGSFLVYDGSRYIYALKAKVGELWRFDVPTGRWDLTAGLEPMPLVNGRNRKKKPGEGAAGAWYENGFYAFKGGNTNEVWRYYVAGDSWVEKDTLKPIGHTMRKKLVKAGGDLVEAGYALWGFKGNSTTEFWRYGIPLGVNLPGGVERSGVAGAGAASGVAWRLDAVPNPFNGRTELRYSLALAGQARLELLDVMGRAVMVLADGWRSAGQYSVDVDARGLAAGVYLARLRVGSGVTVHGLTRRVTLTR
jgi:hypothetical protein